MEQITQPVLNPEELEERKKRFQEALNELPALEAHLEQLDVLVECPVPGAADGQKMTLGDFAATEQGQKFLGNALDSVKQLENAGIESSKALFISLGGAAVKDAQGEFVRAEIFSPATPKKK